MLDASPAAITGSDTAGMRLRLRRPAWLEGRVRAGSLALGDVTVLCNEVFDLRDPDDPDDEDIYAFERGATATNRHGYYRLGPLPTGKMEFVFRYSDADVGPNGEWSDRGVLIRRLKLNVVEGETRRLDVDLLHASVGR